ncbi:EAL domain-containing protein [Pseudomonas saudiphocaensis]|uniref:cyclic-guanylate-specific phosphodiesterase n=1 Tax=Pseudomonas saudiphocaensis TaxID=1499686 RepID=A0A078LWY2_9PSED|nr:EAL domain-containing protein [Pseudomonas saudiphocaensis]CDZ95719.1 PAS/PAC sensor-containing diguanylate cyclase/phosphodiesterase [Pseudomonas saudiphocaensis]
MSSIESRRLQPARLTPFFVRVLRASARLLLPRRITERCQLLRYSAVALQAIDERILISDFHGRLRFLNSGAETMFGLCNADASAYLLQELLPGLDAQALDTSNVEADLCLEIMRLLQGGEWRLFTLTRRALRQEGEQQASGFVWVLRDVTREKQAQTALAERERFWSEVLQAVPDTLYVQDLPSGQMLFSNGNLAARLGYSAEERGPDANAFWQRICHPDDVEYVWRLLALRGALSDGAERESLLRWRHRDGSWHWFNIVERVLSRDEHGRVQRVIGVARDVTGNIERSHSLRESERRYRMLTSSLRDVIFSTDSAVRINYVSPAVETVFGYSPEWALEHGLDQLVIEPRQAERFYDLMRRVRKASFDTRALAELGQNLHGETLYFDCRTADGRLVAIELRVMLILDEHKRFDGALCIGRDISDQRQAEKELRRAATVFEHSTAAILVTDPEGRIVQVNSAFSRITGYGQDEVLGEFATILGADIQQSNRMGFILGQIGQSGSWEGEFWIKHRNSDAQPCWLGITAVRDDEDELVSYVCFFSDMSERKASENRIHRLAYYDSLTQLPNRALFQDRLHSSLQMAARHSSWIVLMFLDLDRFKPINDSLGHAAGDRMLRDVAVRLESCVDEADTVARMGGDEFTLLLQPEGGRDEALSRAMHVAERILESLSEPFVLSGREFFVTASIGIALSPQDGEDMSQLMKNADTAMYHAKERGKNNFQFYQAEMNASALERLELESDLRHALEERQFLLHYQPQYLADGMTLTGVEALLRWWHPSRGLVSPADFIPALEELGLVVEVGDWVLDEACRQMAEWQAAGLRVPRVSVNLSARQFSDGRLGQRIAAILQARGIEPSSLELELTESILMRDIGEAMEMLDSLKRLGLSIAIDDFGTGYSSLNYLKQLPIDVLKIDRCFVDGLPQAEQDGQITRAIIAMSHSLSLSVIAEGVETQEQLDFLREHGCDEVQGFFLARPMPAEQLAQACLGGRGD